MRVVLCGIHGKVKPQIGREKKSNCSKEQREFLGGGKKRRRGSEHGLGAA